MGSGQNQTGTHGSATRERSTGSETLELKGLRISVTLLQPESRFT